MVVYRNLVVWNFGCIKRDFILIYFVGDYEVLMDYWLVNLFGYYWIEIYIWFDKVEKSVLLW